MSEDIIIAILTALLGGGTVGGLISFLANRNKLRAETDNIVLKGAKELVQPLTDQINRLEGELCKERDERKKIEKCLLQVKEDAAKRSEDNHQRIIILEEALRGKDAEIATLQSEAEALKKQVAQQRQQIKALEDQLEALKETPVTKLEKKKTGPLKDC